MDIGIISKHYAKALYAFACRNSHEAKVYAEMQAFAENYRQVPRLREMLDNPALPAQEKAALLCNAAGGKVSDEYKRFAELILQKGREKFMLFMAHSFIELYRKEKQIHFGTLITANPMDEETLNRLKGKVAKGVQGTLEFEQQTDPSLLGGFIFELNFNRLDASVANQISRVRQQFLDKNRRIV
jgi:F-type H+-transporting ATPase subunit delta